MPESERIVVPVLQDIVVKGKEITNTGDLPDILTEIQVKALQQQIDKIIRSRFQKALDKAMQEATQDIKSYLDKELPKMVKTAIKKQ